MPRPGRLFWKLFAGNALLLTAVLGLAVWLLIGQVDRFYADELTTTLLSHAQVLRETYRDRFDAAHSAELTRALREATRDEPMGLRITFISADGQVIADSEADPETMELHGGRTEVKAALATGAGEEVRFSQTTARPMKYLAVRVGAAESPLGVVRVSLPIRKLAEQAEYLHRLFWWTAGLALAAALLLAFLLAKIWSNPIRRITLTARRLSRGDLSVRVPVIGRDELGTLAGSLNEMRDHLTAHLETIDRQRRTLDSLVAQLQEGVVVAGSQGQIVLINPAACRLLGLSPPSDLGSSAFQDRPVEAVVSQHGLQRMLLGEQQDEGIHEVQLHSPGHTSKVALLARSSEIVLPASQSGEGTVGRLLVLTDVTELTRMMQVRADFAANASHELRTPLSAIRAAVETLLGLDLAREPGDAREFISVVDRQCGRMEAMVSDLLNLSRIESSPGRFPESSVDLRALAEGLRERFCAALEAKDLHWTADLPSGSPTLTASPELLGLIVENLVENAIKFTEPGGHIHLACRLDSEEAILSVSDDGCGIPEDEQERVFERFYQVQRARSGPTRGTGLGLAIVRHAVAAMHGTVELRSRSGEGTSVTIRLPLQISAGAASF